MKKIYVDFETFYDSKTYSLRDVSMTEYIRDPRFLVLGCGYYIQGEDGVWEYGWVRNENMDEFKSLDWSNLMMVAHNAKFDGAIFAWKYGIRPASYLDTQSLSRAVLGQNLSSHSLKSVSSYLGLPPKGELKSDGLATLSPQQEQEMMLYNRRDLECCKGIDDKLSPKFPQDELWSMDWTIRAFINPKMVLDTDILDKMVLDERERKEKLFAELGIPAETFSSSKKFAALLAERGHDVPTKPSPKNKDKLIPAFSLSDPGFVALKAVCPDLHAGRVAAKSTITESRGSNLAAIGRTGAFPFDVQYSGAIGTHRYSGGSGGGGNPQNFPNKGPMRRSVVAPPKHVLVIRDFAAIEARLVAWLAKQPELMAIFSENGDVYSAFGPSVYGHTITKKTHPKERQVCKTCILGLGYQMGAPKFQLRVALPEPLGANVKLPIEECYRIVDVYRTTYDCIPMLWGNASELITQMASGSSVYVPFAPFIRTEKHALVLPSGLRIQYPNLHQIDVAYVAPNGQSKSRKEWVYDVYEKKYSTTQSKIYGGKLVENICQALAGEICKVAIRRIEEAGVPCYGQIHDEIIAVVPEGQADVALQVMQDAMETPIPWWPSLRLASEGKICHSWAEAKA